MTMRLVAVLASAATLALACRTVTDDGSPPGARPKNLPPTNEADQRGVLLHCIGLQPPRRGACDKGEPAVTALVVAARTQTFREAALDLSMQMRFKNLTETERIIAQNAAFYLAMVDWPGRMDSIRLMRELALDPAAFHKMGEMITPEIGLWLDDPGTWREQRVLEFPLRIEKQLRYTQWFRAVLSKDTRALVGQLVGVDKNWEPHITPLSGGFQALRGSPGRPDDLSACVTELDVEARRCGAAAGLDALMLLDPPPQQLMPFVLPFGGPNKANCRSCHGAPPHQFVEELQPEEAKTHLAARRAAFLKEARIEIAKLKEMLREVRE